MKSEETRGKGAKDGESGNRAAKGSSILSAWRRHLEAKMGSKWEFELTLHSSLFTPHWFSHSLLVFSVSRIQPGAVFGGDHELRRSPRLRTSMVVVGMFLVDRLLEVGEVTQKRRQTLGSAPLNRDEVGASLWLPSGGRGATQWIAWLTCRYGFYTCIALPSGLHNYYYQTRFFIIIKSGSCEHP